MTWLKELKDGLVGGLQTVLCAVTSISREVEYVLDVVNQGQQSASQHIDRFLNNSPTKTTSRSMEENIAGYTKVSGYQNLDVPEGCTAITTTGQVKPEDFSAPHVTERSKTG